MEKIKKLDTHTHPPNFKSNPQTPKICDTQPPSTIHSINTNNNKPPSAIRDIRTTQNKPAADSFICPYCKSSNFVKRGFRLKKREKLQLYVCKDCKKTFSTHLTSGKHYPLSTILAGLSLYYLGHSLESACRVLNSKYNYSIQSTSLSNWIKEFKGFCSFSRLRAYALQKYNVQDMTSQATLVHRQLFCYRFHRAKCQIIIHQDIKHSRFGPLKEFLEIVPDKCPHEYFSQGSRASQAPIIFSKKQMIVRAKHNYANKLCRFVLQSVKNRYIRHEEIQKFMIYNDSVTVATEVPVYITIDDLKHLKNQLGFVIYSKENWKLPKLITGHIDFLQIRNGQIHILDYKPKAKKIRPIEQLTLYAIALSRLTGLRLFDFKCAWFDETDYFEFFPLHVLYKPKTKRVRKKITTKEGIYILNEDVKKIISLKPKKTTSVKTNEPIIDKTSI